MGDHTAQFPDNNRRASEGGGRSGNNAEPSKPTWVPRPTAGSQAVGPVTASPGVATDRSYRRVYVDYVDAADVVCGRDKWSQEHPGNQRFRGFVQSHRDRYQGAQRRADKTCITNEVISLVHRDGGRFLKRDEDSGMWYVLDQVSVHDKVSHALRSSKPPQNDDDDSGEGSPGNSQLHGLRKRPRPSEQDIEVEEAYRTVFARQQEIYEDLLKRNSDGGGASGSDATEQGPGHRPEEERR